MRPKTRYGRGAAKASWPLVGTIAAGSAVLAAIALLVLPQSGCDRRAPSRTAAPRTVTPAVPAVHVPAPAPVVVPAPAPAPKAVTLEPAPAKAPADAPAASALETRDGGWCDITVPKTAAAGEKIDIRIRTKAFGQAVYLCCDLKDEHHGMMQWGGPPRKLADGEETVYRLTIADKPGLKNVYAYLMAFADADRKTELKNGATPLIAVTGATALPAISYKNSWISIEEPWGDRVYKEGEAWELPVEYSLDQAEARGGTRLNVWVAGPWIDCPVEPYTTKRFHEMYAGLSGRIDAQVGRHTHVFKFTMPKAREHNGLLIIANFVDADGKNWPWQVRGGGPRFVRMDGQFELDAGTPGNLFTYAQPVKLFAELRNVAAGQEKTLRYAVYDTSKAKVAEGSVPFTARKDGQRVPIDLTLGERRGTFLVEAEVDGWEKRHTTFCRVPDVLAVTKGGKTKFGMHDIGDDETCRVAQMLGLTSARVWFGWRNVEPGRGIYKLGDWRARLERARKYGIEPWLCIVNPPAWALEESAKDVHFAGFRCDLEAWGATVTALTTAFKGPLFGWEWLNEIVPSGAETAVDDYVNLCRVASAAAKRVDPKIVTLMAGGLWPRSFRNQLLAAGLGKHCDVLPVHYSNGGGVLEARADLDAVGATNVDVWDDETARGESTWNMPPVEQVALRAQSQWILTQWPDELVAGCSRIVYFGGQGDAAGNWTYMLDDNSPRPVVATLAVLTSKLHGAEPVGVFSLGSAGVFHLFDRNGAAVLLASTGAGDERVELDVGRSRALVITDYQGCERSLRADGKAALDLTQMPFFVEGADLDVLKAYVVPAVQTNKAAQKRSSLVSAPRVTALRGRDGELFVRLNNCYPRPLSGSFRIAFPAAWGIDATTSFALAPGELKVVSVPVRLPDSAEATDYALETVFTYSWDKLPEIRKGLVLSVISADMLGNLFPGGDFESDEGWGFNGTTKRSRSSESLGLGLGSRVLEFVDTKGAWEHIGRTLDLRGGHTYLYTAWVRNKDMSAGSNIYQTMKDGTTRPIFNNGVFNAGENNAWWQVFVCRYNAPETITSVGFTPVVNGKGYAYFDNIRVSIFEGTDNVAEAFKVARAPTIDGALDDWTRACPIPLIGKNQLTAVDTAYAWTPQNLNGVGYVRWDERNVYLAFEVWDDLHNAQTTGDATVDGDSLVLAFDPTKGAPDCAQKAFCYYASTASPGGGSGKVTLYRPEARAGGLKSGQLIKDSSVYDMAIKRSAATTTYELRIPTGELGGMQTGLGTKFGFAVQLNDSDGGGRAAQMNWGVGLHPDWQPAKFGVVTMVE